MSAVQPRVLSCYLDGGFVPPLAAMQLAWPEDAADAELLWALPGGELHRGRLPRRFGLRVRRQAEDAYSITLLWDCVTRQWFSLRRRDLLSTALCGLLARMGTRLEDLLDQPVGSPDIPVPSAAA